MQEVISKIEQPICHNKLSNEEIIKKIIHEMEICKNSAHLLRNLALQHRSRLNVDDQKFQELLDHHSLVVLNNIVSSLSMIKSCDFKGCFVKKRKMASTLEYETGNTSDDHDHGVSGDIIIPNKKCPITKNRRGCYKRRRHGQSRIMEVTKLSDDGFAWRKYGQKQILNAKHPRNYYRCTHKYDQNCQAIKQVQKISENPTKYMIMYYGNHTCNIDDDNNMLKPCPIVIVEDSPEDHSSDIVVSFESSDQANNNPSSAAAGSGVMQDVYDDNDSMKQEMSSTVSNDSYGVFNQNSPLCSDLTATTGQSSSSVFASDQRGEIILAVDNEENHYSSADVVADYSYIMADCSELLDWLF